MARQEEGHQTMGGHSEENELLHLVCVTSEGASQGSAESEEPQSEGEEGGGLRCVEREEEVA
jgi:hypothetical protein